MLDNEFFLKNCKRKSEYKNLNVLKFHLSNIKSPKAKLSISSSKKIKSFNSKYLPKILSKKNRRESEHDNKDKMKLDISKIESTSSMPSFSSTKNK